MLVMCLKLQEKTGAISRFLPNFPEVYLLFPELVFFPDPSDIKFELLTSVAVTLSFGSNIY